MPRTMNPVPIVVMTAGTPTLTVKKALVSPTRTAAPSEHATATGIGRPTSRISFAANTAPRLIIAPVDRSISPAIINWTIPMAINAGKAMVRRMEMMVRGASMAGLRE